jgi:hypothetical protein
MASANTIAKNIFNALKKYVTCFFKAPGLEVKNHTCSPISYKKICLARGDAVPEFIPF